MVTALYVDRNKYDSAYTDLESDLLNEAIDKYFPTTSDDIPVFIDSNDVCDVIRKCVTQVEYWMIGEERDEERIYVQSNYRTEN